MKCQKDRCDPQRRLGSSKCIFIKICKEICTYKKFAVLLQALLESCLSGRKSRTRNAVYALRRTGGSNPSLSAETDKASSTDALSVYS